MRRKTCVFLTLALTACLLLGCGQQQGNTNGDAASSDHSVPVSPVYTKPADVQTLWTVPCGTGEVSLYTGRETDTLDMVVNQKGEERVARVLTRGEDYEDPAALTAAEFSDLLGYDGFVLTLRQDETGWIQNWYYTLQDGMLTCLADSFGGGDTTSDYPLDLDGDGERELLCNCTYNADGVQEVRAFRQKDGAIEQGTLNTAGISDEIQAGWTMAGAVWSEYDPEESAFFLHYWNQDIQDYDVAQYPAELSSLVFAPYNPQELGRGAA